MKSAQNVMILLRGEWRIYSIHIKYRKRKLLKKEAWNRSPLRPLPLLALE
jgi:hypothetical protein